MRECKDNNIWIWENNFGGQNTNLYIFTYLAQCVNKCGQKSLTFNWKNVKSIVATFDNFVEFCKKTNSNIDTIILDVSFGYQIPKKSHAKSSAKSNMPLLEKIIEVQLRKVSHMMYYKEPFITKLHTAVDVLQYSFIKSGGLTSLLLV